MPKKLTIKSYMQQVKQAKAQCTPEQWEKGVASTRKQLAVENPELLKTFEATLLALQ